MSRAVVIRATARIQVCLSKVRRSSQYPRGARAGARLVEHQLDICRPDNRRWASLWRRPRAWSPNRRAASRLDRRHLRTLRDHRRCNERNENNKLSDEASRNTPFFSGEEIGRVGLRQTVIFDEPLRRWRTALRRAARKRLALSMSASRALPASRYSARVSTVVYLSRSVT